MESKRIMHSELAYVLGMVILALATAMMEKADFGMSMVVAPAYLLHLKVSEYIPAFSFGMAEYVFQAFLIVLLSVVMRRAKISYLFSFITAVLYGFMLDASIAVLSHVPADTIAARTVFYVLGMVLCSLGVALLFHTYISPEAYELFVKELCDGYGFPVGTTKTVYDCVSCLVGAVMSFAFFGFGNFVGVKLGTVICALINGRMIGRIDSFLTSRLEFRDALGLRQLFSK